MYKFAGLFILFLLFMMLFHACNPAQKLLENESFIEEQFLKNDGFFGDVLKNRDSLRVQVIYTKIDRDRKNKPHFTDYYFNNKKDLYFYPASTIKMPLAFLALEKLNQLKINRNSTFITEKYYAGQTAVYNDPSTPDGRPTIEQYIKKIFLVSDNDASNRLYEFLGQQYIHEQLATKGYTDAQILHRLAISLQEDQHRNTNPFSLRDSLGNILFEQSNISSNYTYLVRNNYAGKAFMNGDVKINEPMNFSRKNRLYLTDLHQLLRSVLFPEAVPEQQRFNFTDDDYRFLYTYMSQLPAETIYPDYSGADHYDAYVKFFMFGTQKKNDIPKNIRIFNKVGWAYGFLTDVAYIVDFEKNIEFMISATIYCNADEVLNDDHYDFDTVGLPFLEKLGQQVYNYELQRKRKHMPDLSKFKVTYDK